MFYQLWVRPKEPDRLCAVPLVQVIQKLNKLSQSMGSECEGNAVGPEENPMLRNLPAALVAVSMLAGSALLLGTVDSSAQSQAPRGQVEKGSKGTLAPGSAWVQFCVTAGDKLILSKAGWVKVV